MWGLQITGWNSLGAQLLLTPLMLVTDMGSITAKAGEMSLEISEIYRGTTNSSPLVFCEIFRGCLAPFDKKTFFCPL
jgi:hypothetical protein